MLKPRPTFLKRTMRRASHEGTAGQALTLNCALSVLTGLSLPTVSHHLRKLREQRIVDSRREGKLVFYQLVDEDVRLLLRVAATRHLAAQH